tara:strand:- start:5152 stop:5838 length:687 start_codon:yes stop_codon:yes gene_type:complete
MAENKKSFVAYCDWQETFEELSNEEAGKLVKHLFNYVNDKDPEASDKLTQMCFIPIKQSLKRDLKKYEGYIKKQSDNGKKGGRPKNPTLSEKTQPFIEKAKKADSVSVSVSDSDSVNVTKKRNAKKYISSNGDEYTEAEILEKYKSLISKWNEIKGTKFKAGPNNLASFKFWFEIYSANEIVDAVRNHDNTFWNEKLDPTFLFRQKNKNGPCDYIGELLQHKPKPKFF